MEPGARQPALEELEAGASLYGCGEYVARMDSLHRTDLLTALLFDRLDRKYRTVSELFAASADNWNQTFYILLFRTLGGHTNRTPFMELAQRATYSMLLRERGSMLSVEALLLGTSGLLDLYTVDTYIADLRKQFVYLERKYELRPLKASAWRLHGIKPNNHPLLRIAQAAAFLARQDFVIGRLLECRNEADVRRLFEVEASQYWSTHYIPGEPSDERPKRIGRFMADIIGINTVAILQYAYGSFLGDEELRDRALGLLEALPAEENYCIRRWNGHGVVARNAFESQALLQLGTEYCARTRCRSCPLARRLLKG